jgi:hypothetical protein
VQQIEARVLLEKEKFAADIEFICRTTLQIKLLKFLEFYGQFKIMQVNCALTFILVVVVVVVVVD